MKKWVLLCILLANNFFFRGSVCETKTLSTTRLKDLRLLLKNVWKKEGELNATVLSAKYFQAQINHHQYHSATKFAPVLISASENIASIFGRKQVISYFQDDKTNEALGLAAISK